MLQILDPQMSLAVDGNNGFDLATALNYVQALGAYPLMWLEEPVNPLDYESHRIVSEQSSLPLAVGENLFSADDARNLLRYGGLRRDRDMLQFDISLSYGIVEYRRILDDLSERGWSEKPLRSACRACSRTQCGCRIWPWPRGTCNGHHHAVRQTHFPR